MSLEKLEELCVKSFPLSQTRRAIMDGFREVVRRIVEARLEGELWINGSFLTEKIDPLDIDFFVVVPARFYDLGTDDQRYALEWLMSKEDEPKHKYRCHTDVAFLYPEGSNEAYLSDQVLGRWRALFGFTVKAHEPKGIAVLRLEGLAL